MNSNFSPLQGMRNLLKNRLIGSLLIWERPLSAAVLAGMIFVCLIMTADVPWRVTDRAYFNYLADAFLHGQLHLRLIPPTTNDLSLYNGQYYLYWGPLPALIAMPVVAALGVHASDALQSIMFGAFDVGLFAFLLRQLNRRKFIETSPLQRALIVIFFALGSSFTPLPAVGKVWYLALIEMLFFALLAFIAIFSLENGAAFFAAGCAVCGVLMTRMSAVFIAIFLAWYLLRRHRHVSSRSLLTYCLLGLLPVLITLGILMEYNQLRFGNLFETGVSYQLMDPTFLPDYQQYGLFNLHYFPVNFYYTYIYYPMLSLFTGGWIATWGGSIFLLGPLFFASLTAVYAERRNLDMWFLLLSFLVGNIPILLLMGPNFQFGSRYSLDFMLPLLLLTALGMKRWRTGFVMILVGISVIHYLAGALMYLHFQL
jgi:hypothetical protein